MSSGGTRRAPTPPASGPSPPGRAPGSPPGPKNTPSRPPPGLEPFHQRQRPVVRAEAEDHAIPPHPAVHFVEQPPESEVEAKVLVHDLLAVRPVGVADVVAGGESDGEEVGVVVGTELV